MPHWTHQVQPDFAWSVVIFWDPTDQSKPDTLNWMDLCRYFPKTYIDYIKEAVPQVSAIEQEHRQAGFQKSIVLSYRRQKENAFSPELCHTVETEEPLV